MPPITIPPFIIPQLDLKLEADGPEGDPTIWLYGSFDMWGATFAIEAYRVRDENYSEAGDTSGDSGSRQVLDRKLAQGIQYGDWIRAFQRLGDAHEPDGGFQTVYLDLGNGVGGNYVITIYPLSAS